MVTSKSFDSTNPTGDGGCSSAFADETMGMLKNSTPFCSETRLDDSTSLSSWREGSLRPYLLSTLAFSSFVGFRRSSHDTSCAGGDASACSEAGYAVNKAHAILSAAELVLSAHSSGNRPPDSDRTDHTTPRHPTTQSGAEVVLDLRPTCMSSEHVGQLAWQFDVGRLIARPAMPSRGVKPICILATSEISTGRPPSWVSTILPMSSSDLTMPTPRTLTACSPIAIVRPPTLALLVAIALMICGIETPKARIRLRSISA